MNVNFDFNIDENENLTAIVKTERGILHIGDLIIFLKDNKKRNGFIKNIHVNISNGYIATEIMIRTIFDETEYISPNEIVG